MVVEEAEGLSAPGVALLDGPADLRDGGHRRHRRLHVVPHLVQRQVAALLLLPLELWKGWKNCETLSLLYPNQIILNQQMS